MGWVPCEEWSGLALESPTDFVKEQGKHSTTNVVYSISHVWMFLTFLRLSSSYTTAAGTNAKPKHCPMAEELDQVPNLLLSYTTQCTKMFFVLHYANNQKASGRENHCGAVLNFGWHFVISLNVSYIPHIEVENISIRLCGDFRFGAANAVDPLQKVWTSAQEPFANPVGILTVLNFRPCQALGNYTASWQGYS